MNHEEIIKKEKIYFELVTRLGSEMLENGGEIFRTGDVMQYAAHALGLKDFNTFVIANGIFASMLTGGQTYSCGVRYISLSPMNICRLEALNTLSRRIVAGLDDPLEIETELDRIQSFEASSNKVKILCAGFGSGGFCYLFGGTALDSFVAFFIGLVLQIFLIASDRHLESKFITNILGSGIVTFLSLIVLSAGIPILQDKVVIGDIMPLVPGIALTTSIRDFFNGDYLSGAIHMIDAILTAFSIAVGVGAVITLYQLVTGGALLR